MENVKNNVWHLPARSSKRNIRFIVWRDLIPQGVGRRWWAGSRSSHPRRTLEIDVRKCIMGLACRNIINAISLGSARKGRENVPGGTCQPARAKSISFSLSLLILADGLASLLFNHTARALPTPFEMHACRTHTVGRSDGQTDAHTEIVCLRLSKHSITLIARN